MLFNWIFVMLLALLSLALSVVVFFVLRSHGNPIQICLLSIGFGILAGDFFIFAHFYSFNAYPAFELIFMSLIDTAKMISCSVDYKDIMETLVYIDGRCMKLLFCVFSILTPLIWCDFLLILFNFIKSLKESKRK